MYRYQTSAIIVNLMRFTLAFLAVGWASYLTLSTIRIWQEISLPSCVATKPDLRGTLP